MYGSCSHVFRGVLEQIILLVGIYGLVHACKHVRRFVRTNRHGDIITDQRGLIQAYRSGWLLLATLLPNRHRLPPPQLLLLLLHVAADIAAATTVAAVGFVISFITVISTIALLSGALKLVLSIALSSTLAAHQHSSGFFDRLASVLSIMLFAAAAATAAAAAAEARSRPPQRTAAQLQPLRVACQVARAATASAAAPTAAAVAAAATAAAVVFVVLAIANGRWCHSQGPRLVLLLFCRMRHSGFSSAIECSLTRLCGGIHCAARSIAPH